MYFLAVYYQCMHRTVHNFKAIKKRTVFEVERIKERRWSQIVKSYQYKVVSKIFRTAAAIYTAVVTAQSTGRW
jgi:hypothetical protein